MTDTTMNTGAASLSDEQREQLNLIERCDPSLLIHHIEEDTAYDGPLVARVFELAKERARSLLTTPTPQADAAPIINGHAINDLFLKWSEWTTELGEAISRKNIDGFVSELRAAIAAGGAQESVRPRYQYAQPGSPEFDGAEAYQQHLEEQDSEPVAWVRYRSDGGFEGPIMDTDARMCDTRRSFWTPLYAAPLANEASKPAAQQTLSDGAQFFACYLIDNCENEVVREESVQAWLGKMLASPRYHPAAPPVEQDERGAISEHDAKGIEIIASWMDRDGLIQPAEFLRSLAARAASTSANVAQDELQVRGRMRLKVEKLAGSLTKAEETKNDIIGDDGEQVTGVRIGWGAWALLRASIIDLIEYKCDSDSALAAAYSANVAHGAEAVAEVTNYRDVDGDLRAGVIFRGKSPPAGTPLYAAPPAQTALTDAAIEAGWHQTFSTNNPYCPCNLKSFTKAVQWAERALTAAQSASGDTK
jgi:hypothetical protein